MRRFFSAVAAWWWLLTLMVAGAAAAAYLATVNLLPPRFRAEATLALSGAGAKPDDFAKAREALLARAGSQAVLERAARELSRRTGRRFDAASLDGMIRVRPDRGGGSISIQAIDGDRRVAAAAADAVAGEIADTAERSREDKVQRALAYLRKQAEDVSRREAEERSRYESLAADPRSPEILQRELNARTETWTAQRKQAALLGAEISGVLAARETLRRQMAGTPRPSLTYDRLAADLAEKEAAIAEKRAAMASHLALAREMEAELRPLAAELAWKQAQFAQARDRADHLRQLEKSLQEKIATWQANLASGLGEVHVSVAAPAEVPAAPDRMPATRNAGMGALIGALMGLVLVLLLNARRWPAAPAGPLGAAGRAWDGGRALAGLPVLAYIPEFEAGTKR